MTQPAVQNPPSPSPPPPAPPPPPPPAPPKGRKRMLAVGIFLVLLIVGAIAGTLYWLHARNFEHTDDAAIDTDLVPASAQIAGRIKTVHVRENQDVTAGEVLAEIDPVDFETRVRAAEATLAAARARQQVAVANVQLLRANTEATTVQATAGVAEAQAGVETAQAGVAQAEATVRWAQAQVQSAQADVDAAQAEATRREADVKRYDALDARAVSQQQREAARAAADAAAAQLSAAQKRKLGADAQVAQEESKLVAARSAVTEAKSKVQQAQGVLQTAQTAPQQIAAAEAQVKTADASVEEAAAQLQAAKQQLGYATVTAPISGRVTRKNMEPGQYVEAGQMLCTVVSPDVWVIANFKETQLTHMHVGQAVDITVDVYPDRTFRGKIESIQAGTGARFSLMPPENATGNYVKVVQRVPVKIVFTEDAATKLLLGPGMSVTPRVRIGGDEGTPGPITRGPALTMPAAANR